MSTPSNVTTTPWHLSPSGKPPLPDETHTVIAFITFIALFALAMIAILLHVTIRRCRGGRFRLRDDAHAAAAASPNPQLGILTAQVEANTAAAIALA